MESEIVNVPESITIYGVPCTSITCQTVACECTAGAKITPFNYQGPDFEIRESNFGYANSNGFYIKYTVMWSQHTLWYGPDPPINGDSVTIAKPDQVVFDLADSPKLGTITIDGGSLLFYPDTDPSHQRTFNAETIYIKNGVFEAGTESEPYTSKLTITMS